MSWIFKAFANTFDFRGRAQRAEYWWFLLFYVVATVVVDIMDRAFGTTLSDNGRATGMGVIGILFVLFTLVTALSLGVRRLHDTGRSGWWVLLSFIPLIGGIVLLVWAAQDGTPGANRFGFDPKHRPPSGAVVPG